MRPEANPERLMIGHPHGTTDHEGDNLAETPIDIDPAVVERVLGIVLPSPKPARIVARWWVIAFGLQSIFLAVTILGATRLGLNGVRVLNGAQRALIFGMLGSLGLMAASASASGMAAGMAAGSKIRLDPRMVLAASTLAFLAVFAVLFQDYRMDRFASEGIACLATGLLHAGIAGLFFRLVIRQGLGPDRTATGVATGTLAGMAGFGMLEMHCPILKSMHLMVWHIAVIPLSGFAGYLLGRLVQDLGVKRRLAEFMQ